ncbi:unnamed protein product, partial [Rhizoctonia solani]
ETIEVKNASWGDTSVTTPVVVTGTCPLPHLVLHEHATVSLPILTPQAALRSLRSLPYLVLAWLGSLSSHSGSQPVTTTTSVALVRTFGNKICTGPWMAYIRLVIDSQIAFMLQSQLSIRTSLLFTLVLMPDARVDPTLTSERKKPDALVLDTAQTTGGYAHRSTLIQEPPFRISSPQALILDSATRNGNTNGRGSPYNGTRVSRNGLVGNILSTGPPCSLWSLRVYIHTTWQVRIKVFVVTDLQTEEPPLPCGIVHSAGTLQGFARTS